jgi:hypothetical protein
MIYKIPFYCAFIAVGQWLFDSEAGGCSISFGKFECPALAKHSSWRMAVYLSSIAGQGPIVSYYTTSYGLG